MDPLAPYAYAMTGLCLLQMQRPEEAGPFLRPGTGVRWGQHSGAVGVGSGPTARGGSTRPLHVSNAVALSNRGSFLYGTLGWALASAGKTDAAKAVLAGLRARPTPAATAAPGGVDVGRVRRSGRGMARARSRMRRETAAASALTEPAEASIRCERTRGSGRSWRESGLPAHPAAYRRSRSRTKPETTVGIAVLPFSDMSSAKDQEYLCEGMAEEIMNALVQVGGIRVASRTSAFRARKDGSDLSAIARALSVGHVLEGSVRTSGTRLRVTAQLTDVASGYQLWSERFDREAIDVFAIQDEIAAGVVDAVKARLGPRSGTVHVRAQAHDLNAYRSYLKGRHLRGVEDFGGAIAAFEEAVRLDPAHAPSWTGLAEITVLAAHMGMIPPRAACTSARKMLATAKELQGESADGLHAEAFAAFLERRWDAMETAWRRALELQPDHVLALGSFAITLCARQRLDEALPLFERARAADPLASFPYTLAGWGLLHVRKAGGGPAPHRGRAHLREGGRVGHLRVEHRERRTGKVRRRHRGGRARSRGDAPRAVLCRRPGVGARGGGPRRRCPHGSRRAASPARGLAHRRLRGMATRRARGDRRRLRRARTGRRGAPGPPLLHRIARVRSAPLRPAIRGADARGSSCHPRDGGNA